MAKIRVAIFNENQSFDIIKISKKSSTFTYQNKTFNFSSHDKEKKPSYWLLNGKKIVYVYNYQDTMPFNPVGDKLTYTPEDLTKGIRSTNLEKLLSVLKGNSWDLEKVLPIISIMVSIFLAVLIYIFYTKISASLMDILEKLNLIYGIGGN